MLKEFDLEKYLSKYKNTSIDFFRFPGNYGDSIIWHGTKILLLSLNISEHYVGIPSLKYNDVLFIDGGGNLVDYYSNVRDFLIKKSALYDEIIILPHTIFGEKQMQKPPRFNNDLPYSGYATKPLNELIGTLQKYAQINRIGDFLNSYLDKLEHKDIFFDIQQPVKIYNDKRVKEYIKFLKQNRKDL
jgi:hypothetical protein